VTKLQKNSRGNQFNQLAHDQRSAVSDLSETIYTNGSEVDAIGGFGQQGYAVGEDFEPIGDYEHVVGAGGRIVHNKIGINDAYGMNQFLEDDTFDNTFDNQRKIVPYYTMSTNETGLTGDEWGNQGSYQLQGLGTTTSDFVGPAANDMDSTSDRHRRGRGYRQDLSNDETADTNDIDHDDDDSYYRRRSNLPDKDYDDIPQPVRQSPIVALYDAILSHPLLVCLSFPCIPCLAVYVKSAERHIPPPPRLRSRSKRTDHKDDESTFAQYNANQRRFDDISRDESRSDANSMRGSKPNSRMRNITSTNSDYSAVNSRFGMRYGRPNSRAGTADFSQIQSRGRPSSSGMMSGQYDSFGNHLSHATDSAGHFMENVPQGEWYGTSVDNTPKIRYSSSNHSVGWKLDHDTQSRGTSEGVFSQSYDQVATNQQFWGKAGDTFSTHTGQGPESHASSSFGPANNRWNRVTDSVSNQNHRYSHYTHMGQMVPYNDRAYASRRGYGNHYYGQ